MIGRQVQLTAEDAMCATSVCTLQMLRKVANNRALDHGTLSSRGSNRRWGDTLNGLMGEIAFAHLFNLPWTPGGLHISHGDVDNRIEVRATEYAGGHLMVYPDEDGSKTFALMTGHYPLMTYRGCILGSNGRRDDWWHKEGNPPAWWVPQSFLCELEEV